MPLKCFLESSFVPKNIPKCFWVMAWITMLLIKSNRIYKELTNFNTPATTHFNISRTAKNYYNSETLTETDARQ